MFSRAQQQQPQRDRIAVQQQMSGSNDFQAQPQPGADHKPRQLTAGSHAGSHFAGTLRAATSVPQANSASNAASPASPPHCSAEPLATGPMVAPTV
jgi:hypothetical protein